MYSYFKGTITKVTPTYLVCETNNIGFIIKVGNPFDYSEQTEITIYVHQIIREDSCDLYGFKQESDRDLFIKLINVKGLGPKGALAIVASSSASKIIDAIEQANSKFFAAFPGIGIKTSQQIILDLKGKVDFNNADPKSAFINDVSNALKALGYSQTEIKKATLNLNQNQNLGEAIKEALKRLTPKF